MAFTGLRVLVWSTGVVFVFCHHLCYDGDKIDRRGAMNILSLQNGSDIRGIALEGKAGPVTLTTQAAAVIGDGFVKWLRKSRKDGAFKVAVGMDSRLSGPTLKEAVTEALTAGGCQVLDCGLATTPAMFMSTVLGGYGCDGAVMVTASHLPMEYNGLKFFTSRGGLESADIRWILENGQAVQGRGQSELVQPANLLRDYAAHLREKIRLGVGNGLDKPLAGFKVVVDAGNGCGGFFAHDVLAPLGADISGSQFLEPDGRFPNHPANPEDHRAIEAVTKAVINNGADLGIVFDTDVDRVGLIGDTGEELNKNALIALMAYVVLEQAPGATIVTDSVTSIGLARFIEERGGVHHRFKRGYRNVINEAIRLTREGTHAPLAMETSGHGALEENYYLDDGAYLAAKLLVTAARIRATGGKLTGLIAGLIQPTSEKSIRLNILAEDFVSCGGEVLSALEKFLEEMEGWEKVVPNYEGVRVDCGDEKGWFLLRMSLHEPVMPLNIESETPEGADLIWCKLKPFISRFDQLEQL